MIKDRERKKKTEIGLIALSRVESGSVSKDARVIKFYVSRSGNVHVTCAFPPIF